jgi:hypothetical protein
VCGLTEEKFLIGSLRHLHTNHAPFIKHYGFYIGWLLEIVVISTSAHPGLLVLYFSLEFFLGSQAGHIVWLSLNNKEGKL